MHLPSTKFSDADFVHDNGTMASPEQHHHQQHPQPQLRDSMGQQRLSLRASYQERLGSNGGAVAVAGSGGALTGDHYPEPLQRSSALALVTPLREINSMAAGPAVGPLQRRLCSKVPSGGCALPEDEGECCVLIYIITSLAKKY